MVPEFLVLAPPLATRSLARGTIQCLAWHDDGQNYVAPYYIFLSLYIYFLHTSLLQIPSEYYS